MQTQIDITWTPIAGGQPISGGGLVTHDGGNGMDFPVAGGSTNLALDFNSLNAARVGLLLYCDRALTVKVNSSSEPDETITLVAGEPKVWRIGAGTSFITDDITAFYVTLAAGADATFKVRTLENTVAPS